MNWLEGSRRLGVVVTAFAWLGAGVGAATKGHIESYGSYFGGVAAFTLIWWICWLCLVWIAKGFHRK